jgi:hypothetical protein
MEKAGILYRGERLARQWMALAQGTHAIAHAGEARVRDSVAAAIAPLTAADGRVKLRKIFRLTRATRH